MYGLVDFITMVFTPLLDVRETSLILTFLVLLISIMEVGASTTKPYTKRVSDPAKTEVKYPKHYLPFITTSLDVGYKIWTLLILD